MLPEIVFLCLLLLFFIAAFAYLYRCLKMFQLRGVPTIALFPTHKTLMKEQLSLKTGASLLDLGAGTGSALRFFADQYELEKLVGVDLNKLALRWGKRKNKQNGYTNIDLVYQDIFRTDVSGYKYIYMYLLPGLMPKVQRYLEEHAQPGTIIISNAFALPDRTPQQVLSFPTGSANIYLYEIGAS